MTFKKFIEQKQASFNLRCESTVDMLEAHGWTCEVYKELDDNGYSMIWIHEESEYIITIFNSMSLQYISIEKNGKLYIEGVSIYRAVTLKIK